MYSREELSCIFEQAIQLESSLDREELIESRCGGNSELKERIYGLIKAFEESDDFLESPVSPLTNFERDKLERFLKSAKEAEFIEQRIGTLESSGDKVGSFLLGEKLGAGGFGVVFQAEQLEPVRRQVAVKLIKPGMDTEEVLSRFDLERQALAVMDHPSIARIFDAGSTLSGRPFFAMELVKGEPITRHCDEKRFGIRDRIELMIKVCRGVQHAHQKGIIHRDLKPSNILVDAKDAVAVPKLIDFGVAKALDWKNRESVFTRRDQKVGTPLYMSPEQASGRLNHDIDVRSDVYSLGAVLFELVSGSTPIDRETLKKSSTIEIFEMIRLGKNPTPSERLKRTATSDKIAFNRKSNASSLIREVNGELDWIISKSLEPDREHRYQSANDLANDLCRYLANKPVDAAKPTRSYRLKKFIARHRVPVLTATAFAGTLLMATASSFWFGYQAHLENQRANRETEKYQMLSGDLVNFVQIATFGGQESARQRKMDSLVESILERSDQAEAFQGEYLFEFGKALFLGLEYESAAKVLKKCYEVTEIEFGPHHRNTLDAMHGVCEIKLTQAILNDSGKGVLPDDGMRSLGAYLPIAEELCRRENLQPTDESRAYEALQRLAAYYRKLGRYDEAIEAASQSVEGIESSPAIDRSDLVYAYGELAKLHEIKGDGKRAVEFGDKSMRASFEIQSNVPEARKKKAQIEALFSRNTYYSKYYLHHKSLPEMLEQIELAEALYADRPLFTFPAMIHLLGRHYSLLFRVFKSIEANQKCLSIAEELLKKKDCPTLVSGRFVAAYRSMAVQYIRLEQPESALRILENIPPFAEGLLSKQDSLSSRLEHQRCIALAKTGKHEQAIDLANEIVSLALEIWGKAHDNYLTARKELALVLDLSGDTELGNQIREELLEIVFDPDLSRMVGAHLINEGEYDRGIAMLKECQDTFDAESKGELRTNFYFRNGFTQRYLALAFSKTGQVDRAIELLEKTLADKLSLYGEENLQTVATRQRMCEILLKTRDLERAKQKLKAMDQAYLAMIDSVEQQWPKGWQSIAYRNQWHLARLRNFSDVHKEHSEFANQERLRLEMEMLAHYELLQNSEFENNEIKLEALRVCICHMIRLYEIKSELDAAADWKDRLDKTE